MIIRKYTNFLENWIIVEYMLVSVTKKVQIRVLFTKSQQLKIPSCGKNQHILKKGPGFQLDKY